MNYVNVAVNSITIVFFILLVGVYVSKKNMDNIENKLYRKILFWNGIDLVVHMGWLFIGHFLRDYHYAVQTIANIHFAAVIIMTYYLTYYAVVVSNQKNEKFNSYFIKNKNRVSKITGGIIFTLAFIELFLPTTVFYEDGILTICRGMNEYYFYVVFFSLLATSTFSIVKNRKNSDKKKLFAFKMLGTLSLITLVFYVLFPSVCVIVVLLTMVSFIMYFTIENPDINLISELTLAKNEAEKASNAKSDFLSSMSHELKTPLNAILGLSESINYETNQQEVKDDTKDIIISAQNLLELVDGILDSNKLERNQMEIVESNYSPRQILDELVQKAKIRLSERPIELRVNYDEQLPLELYGDKEKFTKIVSNILSNAVKYTENGFVDLIVKCRNEKDECHLTVSVKDTGRGISAEQKEKLFSRFYRLEEDKDTDIQGTGLGLSVTKALVELLNGNISVDTTLGVGSTFTIKIVQKIITLNNNSNNDNNDNSRTDEQNKEIENNDTKETLITEVEPPVITAPPIVESLEIDNQSTDVSAPKLQEQQEQPATIQASGEEDVAKKVLVVDDNKLNLKVTGKMLQEYGYEIQTVTSGMEAIENVNGGKHYDLIFMDIMMPNMDGVETMKRLKNINNFTTPVVALTADAMEGSREKYLGEGFDDYFSKPIIKDILEEILKKFNVLN